MDWGALSLSLKLAAWTALLLVPLGMLIARQLAWRRFGARAWVEALVALPLVLPPTVLGYYLLSAFGGAAWRGMEPKYSLTSTSPPFQNFWRTKISP